jgi:hypothetical protein
MYEIYTTEDTKHLKGRRLGVHCHLSFSELNFTEKSSYPWGFSISSTVL